MYKKLMLNAEKAAMQEIHYYYTSWTL